MDKNEFLENLKQSLQTEENINFDTILDDLAEWDSLGMMATAVMLEKNYKYKTGIHELIRFLTIEELYEDVNK